MTKSDGPRVWGNRLLSLVAGGLIVLVIMSLAAVAPVKAENATLTKQLDELQNGAAKLLTEAKAYVSSKSYNNAQQSLEALLAKHPNSSEAVEGKKLSADVAALVAQREQKWESSIAAIKSAWENSTAAKLRADGDAVRQGIETTMAATLKAQWEQSKDRIRQDWEAGES